MPELPEVETNAKNLSRWGTGRRIVRVSAPIGGRQSDGVPAAVFRARLEGRTIEDVRRSGKWTLVRLSGGAGLGLHLGMTGKLQRLADPEAPSPRFARATLALDDGSRICFVDSRRFGKLVAVARWDELAGRREIASLGPDARTGAGVAHLRAALGRTRRTVKEAIMDQRVLAGVGNLYATEALWRARIHPAEPAPGVARDEASLRRLARGLRAALDHGLAELEGAELPEYLEDGAPNPFRVYDRAGQPCPRCREPIEAIRLGGRTSAFCPRCQPSTVRRKSGQRLAGPRRR